MTATISRGRRSVMERREVLHNKFKPENLPDDVTLYSTDELSKMGLNAGPEVLAALRQLTHMQSTPSGNPFSDLKAYRACVPLLINWALANQSLYRDAEKAVDRMQEGAGSRSNKRWTPEEDEALIEMAASGRQNLLELSVTFGRTPNAVTSRITYLVGIRRLSQEIAGHLTGYINGEPVEGEVVGVVTKRTTFR